MPRIGNPVGGEKHKPQWAKDLDRDHDIRAVTRLRDKLDQIAAVCRDNAKSTCDKGMALDFVRQIAES